MTRTEAFKKGFRILYIDNNGDQVLMKGTGKNRQKITSDGKIISSHELRRDYDYVGMLDKYGALEGVDL